MTIPEYLLIPVEHPEAGEAPHTIQSLLLVIEQYENKLDQANDRILAIKRIQESTKRLRGFNG